MLGQMVTLAWEAPRVDFHAVAPEIVVSAVLMVMIVVDSFTGETKRWSAPTLAGIGLLAALIPVATLAHDATTRSMFGGAYVVDNFALVLKALFLVVGYVVVLMSTNYIAEGDFWEGEYYQLLLASILGMMVMASARDLISIFIALELLSIPAYMLAAWRKRDDRSNEAGLKYFLMGVFASGIMLYGMSLLYGASGSTLLSDIAVTIASTDGVQPIITLGIAFSIIGFAFKVSAVPFHTWAPDVYEGSPTPVTAFLAVASKAAGFVALLTLIFVGFYGTNGGKVVQPLLFVLSIVSMTAGNMIALRQKNIIRMMAYSGIANAGYMLGPLAIAGTTTAVGVDALQAVVIYLIVYAAMNLGAFATIVAVGRKTGSNTIDSYRGLFRYSPALATLMMIFLFSLAGIPPLAGWFGKFVIFRSLVASGTNTGYVLAIFVGLNSVIALFYYARITRLMFMEDPVVDDTKPINVPVSLTAALVITTILTFVMGIAPALITHFTDGITLLGVTP